MSISLPPYFISKRDLESQLARAEATYIANTDDQYLVPTSGKPLRGLIQDHVVGGLWLTNKASFFTREEYQQLIYGALRPENGYTGGGRVIILPPAILKPRPLWTGKQIVSQTRVEGCGFLTCDSRYQPFSRMSLPVMPHR